MSFLSCDGMSDEGSGFINGQIDDKKIVDYFSLKVLMIKKKDTICLLFALCYKGQKRKISINSY